MEPVTKEEALQYDLEALKANVVKAEKNIDVFEEAITKEREGIKRLKQMITILEERKK
jgi:peptidoglycan hydrolase CwlO-like protein